jgi:hypothetical protein
VNGCDLYHLVFMNMGWFGCVCDVYDESLGYYLTTMDKIDISDKKENPVFFRNKCISDKYGYESRHDS